MEALIRVTVNPMNGTRSLLFIIFLFLSPAVVGQEIDSTQVEWRSVSGSTLQELESDKDLFYPTEATESVSWWTRLLALLAAVINWITQTLGMTNSNTVMNIIYFVSTVIVVWLIWRLFLSKYDWIFGSAGKAGIKDYSVANENIHEIDYEKAIQEALGSNDFRLAVRLIYLRTLKLLSDREVIHYQEGKTNNEYTREVSETEYGSSFVSLSYHFNYLWYGHFEAGKHNWESAETEFNKIKNMGFR